MEAEGEEETTKNDQTHEIDINEGEQLDNDQQVRNIDESIAVVIPSDTQSLPNENEGDESPQYDSDEFNNWV